MEIVAALVGGLLALAGVGLSGRLSSRSARDEREHRERLERRPLFREACAELASEMRRAGARQWRRADEIGLFAAQEPHGPTGEIDPRHEPGVSLALEKLRLVADDEVFDAARAWLEEHYRTYWDGAEDADLEGAERTFHEAAKRSLGLGG